MENFARKIKLNISKNKKKSGVRFVKFDWVVLSDFLLLDTRVNNVWGNFPPFIFFGGKNN